MPKRPGHLVVVTGAGFIGSQLVEALLAEGSRVRCLRRTLDWMSKAPGGPS